MIISASRRTDIPSYYSKWFFNRLKDGYVYVRNPMNPHQISKVSLSPDVVDGIVFWTKNPAPILNLLDGLCDYPYYFQFTLTPYENDIERNLPSKDDNIIPIFQKLSSQIGRERVVWRYDPILLNEKYTLQYHIKHFRMLCDKLADYTEKCTISFLDIYKSINRNVTSLGIRSLSFEEAEEIAGCFSGIAKGHGIYIDTCAEVIDLSKYGIAHSSCIDRCRLERIGNYRLNVFKDKNQRKECGCVSSIDIGAYNTCKNGCVYCYANFNQTLVNNCCKCHDQNSPLLYGKVSSEDIVKTREMMSLQCDQFTLFE